MANWLKPAITDLYTQVLDWLKARDTDLAKGLDPAAVTVDNPEAGFLRYASANRRWEKYDGTSWGALSTSYAINADTASKWQTPRTLTLAGGVTGSVSWDGSANATITATVTQGAGSGFNADLLDGQHGAYYADIAARLGYSPVQQGTGIGQTANIVKIGWSAGGKLKATVDSSDLGALAFEGWTASYVASAIASKANDSGTYSGLNVGYATSAGNADTVDGWHRDDLRAWGNLTGKPNTISGYGITDALVYNNWGTYNINITGSSSYATSAGTAAYVTNITTAQVLAAIAGASAGDVGTHVFGTINGGGVAFGGVYAGSSIIPSGVYHTSMLALDTAGSGNSSALVTGGGYLSGSWRAMGTENHYIGTQYARATLFLRIA